MTVSSVMHAMVFRGYLVGRANFEHIVGGTSGLLFANRPFASSFVDPDQSWRSEDIPVSAKGLSVLRLRRETARTGLANTGPRIALSSDMGSAIREVDIREILERHRVLYEVRPYYIMLDLAPVGAPATQQRIQAGFDVNVCCTLEKEQLSIYHSESARMVVNYFEKVAQEIQARIGQNCTVEVIPYEDSLVLDTRDHLPATNHAADSD